VHLGLDYLATNLAFNVFGAIGLLFLYDAIRHVSSAHRVARSIGILVTFLPSLSFWSCAIGKDSVAFLGVVLALRASLYVPYRIWMFVLGATILVMVRPHVATLMAFVGMMALAFQGRKIRWRRLPVVVAGMILSFGIAIWTLQSYVGIETQDSIAEYVDGRQMLELGSASVDLTSMSVPMRLFTYMFRPLLWEASSLMQVLAAIENIIILAIFAIGVYQLNRFGTRLLPQQWIFMIGPDYQ
jgi:hypothetical protein